MYNHKSHISIESLNYTRKNGMILLTIHEPTSHKLQQLLRAVYAPLKRYFIVENQVWIINHTARRITIDEISDLFGISYPKAISSSNIVNGFKVTYI